MKKTNGKRSLVFNMLINGLRGVLSVIFPLITFPYISDVLGVECLGKYNFDNSIVSYFSLLAALGISTYAVREGAIIREDKERISKFSSEMFTINLLSTLVAYVLLFFAIIISEKLNNNRVLIYILSIQIILKTVGIEWIYSIYEDYIYITIRSVVIQILSIVFMFLFVKNESDLYVYAFITVVSAAGANVLNYIRANKYCDVRVTRCPKIKNHIKPILILFAMTATVTIYVSSDTIILGFLCDDYTVGIYSVSVKIYTIVKTLLASVLVVSVPRLSSLYGKDKEKEFNALAEEVYNTLLTVLIPAIVGIILLRKEIILFISSKEYISAESSLVILGVALIFCLGAWFWGQCILVTLKKDKKVFTITVVGALVNVFLNILLIPIWKEDAAAFTTVLAEGVSFVLCYIEGRKYVEIGRVFSLMMKIFVGCIPIFAVVFISQLLIESNIVRIVISLILSVALYSVIEMIVKNETITSLMYSVKKKIFRC